MSDGMSAPLLLKNFRILGVSITFAEVDDPQNKIEFLLINLLYCNLNIERDY